MLLVTSKELYHRPSVGSREIKAYENPSAVEELIMYPEHTMEPCKLGLLKKSLTRGFMSQKHVH